MLFPVSRTVFRWSTPDPMDDWLMIGHLVLNDEEVVLIDPPLVPGLVDAVAKLGRASSIILTTADHARGAGYLSTAHKIQIFMPKQVRTTNFDPEEELRHMGLKEYENYDEGTSLPAGLTSFRVRPYVETELPRYDELAILTKTGELLVGDIAEGTVDGRFLTGPEFFYNKPEERTVRACFDSVKAIVTKGGARSLLSSHGYDIVGTLQQAVADWQPLSR